MTIGKTPAALAAAIFLALPAAAMAKPYAVEPTAGEGQTVRFVQGVGSVVSIRPGSDVWAIPTARSFDKRLTLTIGVENKGDEAAEFDIPHVEVFTAEGEPLEVYTLDKLEKEAKNKAAWASFGVALVGAVAGAATSYDTSYASYGRSTVKLKTFNPAAADLTAQQTEAALGKVQENLGARLADLGQTVLMRTTVDPGQSTGGYVTIAVPPKTATALRVRVTFAGEVHELQFAIKR